MMSETSFAELLCVQVVRLHSTFVGTSATEKVVGLSCVKRGVTFKKR